MKGCHRSGFGLTARLATLTRVLVVLMIALVVLAVATLLAG